MRAQIASRAPARSVGDLALERWLRGFAVIRSRERVWPGHLVALAGYVLLAAGTFGAALRNPGTVYPGSIPDATQSVWFLSWTAHAMSSHHGLLFSDALNAPNGVNLMWNTPMTLLGMLVAPVTLTLGAVVAYNLLMVAALATSAWAAYFLFHRYCGSRRASWIGGLLFAFGPYMVAQSLGHLDLIVMSYPAIAALLIDSAFRNRRRWWLFGGLLGVATAAQLLVMEEVVVGVAIGAVAVAIIAAARWPASLAKHAKHAAKVFGVASMVFLVLSAYPLSQQLMGVQVPAGFHQVASPTSSDLLGFVVPTANQAVAPAPATATAAHFVAQSTGQDAYVGLPLLALAILLTWTFRRSRVVTVTAALAVVFAVLSLGPSLNVDGHVLPGPMPWGLIQHLPLADNLVPLRLIAFADLCLAGIVAYGLSRMRLLTPRRRATVAALTVAAAASWFPALPRPVLAAPDPPTLPATVSRAIPPQGTVLFAPLPSQSTADAMWYQTTESFRFRLLSGYAYAQKPDIPLEPVLDSASPSVIDATTRQLSASEVSRAASAYRALGVTTIIVPPGPAARSYIGLMSRVCGEAPTISGGFAVWTLP